ncbi:MAG: hypothetical protein KZQ84_17125 [Candidatus Thiodiazotropha sp. (ex Lucinoma borealis)]|nr:hypothetical protein [Candidatus Thiodiazotropha sp. (ex Lucinoma borealis)]
MTRSNHQLNSDNRLSVHPASPGAELLHEPDIADYINRHQGAADNIRRAADQLAGETDSLKSLTKLLPALTQKSVNVFFSYKAKDEKTAKAVVDILRK